MSDDVTLLTRAEVKKWHNTAGDRQVHVPEGDVERLLRTVDTAHGLLQAELKAAVDEGVAAMINEANERAEKAEAGLAEVHREIVAANKKLGDGARMVIETMKENSELKLKLIELGQVWPPR